jgi:predicted nucleotidyltransferase
MIVTKTEKFNKKFLYDLGDLSIFPYEYIESIKKWDRERKLLSIGFGKQPSKTVKFFGSYFDRKEGSYVSDIDVILLIDSIRDEQFYLRLSNILKNLHKTNFVFVRFYCGYIQGLEPPWKIGDYGECTFNLEKIEKWLENVRYTFPSIYEKLKPFLAKDTISMDDLIRADQQIEPYISLTWTKDEIIKGYKIYNGIKYDFRTAMYNYPRYRVMKFLYNYEGGYCLVDVNFVAKDKSIPRSSQDALSYYTNDVYKKYKYLKKLLRPDKLGEYMQERKNAIGHITPLAAFVELVSKLKKYDVIPVDKLAGMQRYIEDYAKKNKIDTIDYKEIQELILEKITPLYKKYSRFVRNENKESLYVLDIRVIQMKDQVSKKVIRKREKLGYDCPLFPMSIEHIKYLYKKSVNLLLDPYVLYTCIKNAVNQSSLSFPWTIENLFSLKRYRIEVAQDSKYTLYLNDKEIKKSSSLKKLQKIAIID